MTKLEQLKQNYDRALDQYRRKNPVLTNADLSQNTHICGLCGKVNIPGNELQAHIETHNLLPPSNLSYQLTLPFRVINGKIAKGAKFIKLLCLYSNNQSTLTPFNAYNLPDWKKLTDTEDTTIRWSAKKKRFIRTLWILGVILLTQIN